MSEVKYGTPATGTTAPLGNSPIGPSNKKTNVTIDRRYTDIIKSFLYSMARSAYNGFFSAFSYIGQCMKGCAGRIIKVKDAAARTLFGQKLVKSDSSEAKSNHDVGDLSSQHPKLDIDAITDSEAVGCVPKGLPNDGNTCFMASALQAMMCCLSFVRQVEESGPGEPELIGPEKKPAIPGAINILKEIDGQPPFSFLNSFLETIMGDTSELSSDQVTLPPGSDTWTRVEIETYRMQKKAHAEIHKYLLNMIRSVYGQSKGVESSDLDSVDLSIGALRKAMACSGVWADMNYMEKKSAFTRQHDAANVVEMLTDLFMKNDSCKLSRYSTPIGHEHLRFRKDETQRVLQAFLPESGKSCQLGSLVDRVFKDEEENEPRNFYPGEAVEPTDESIITKCKYTAKLRLGNLPAVIPIHIKRFKYNKNTNSSSKNEMDVELPENGGIDLSPYYEGPNKEQASYRIKSIVIQENSDGDLEYGHYYSYVEMGGIWYECNDGSITKISREEALGRKDAYMVILERVNDLDSDSENSDDEPEEWFDALDYSDP